MTRRLKLTAWLTFYWGVALMLMQPWTVGMVAVLAAWYVFCVGIATRIWYGSGRRSNRSPVREDQHG